MVGLNLISELALSVGRETWSSVDLLEFSNCLEDFLSIKLQILNLPSTLVFRRLCLPLFVNGVENGEILCVIGLRPPLDSLNKLSIGLKEAV